MNLPNFGDACTVEACMKHIRDWRAALWHATIPEIAQALERAKQTLETDEAWGQGLPGYTRGRGETLMREIVAVAFIKLVLWSNEATVYGGYVREFVSGKEWGDLDVCFSSSLAIQKFKEMLGTMLRTLLGHPANLHIQKVVRRGSPEHAALYAYEVHRHDLLFIMNARALRLCVDLTTMRNGRDLCKRMPASYGSCLQLTLHGVTFKQYDGNSWDGAYTLLEICEALRNGCDIARLPELKEWANHRSRDKLAQYHVDKTRRLHEIGYEIVKGTGISLAEYPAHYEALMDGGGNHELGE